MYCVGALLIGARTSTQLAGPHLVPFLATLSMNSLPVVTIRSEAMPNLSLSSECCSIAGVLGRASAARFDAAPGEHGGLL